MRQFVATRTAVLRLQGPLADEPAARTLHILLIGMLVWSALQGALVLLRVTAQPAAAAGLLMYQAATCGMALIFLRRGAFRMAFANSMGVMRFIASLLGTRGIMNRLASSTSPVWR